MIYHNLPGIDKQLSAVCLGTAQFGSQQSVDESFRLLDRYAELGGTFLDSAHVYGAWDREGYAGGYGNSEKVIGEWLKKTGMEKEIVVSTKGAHPDLDTAESAMNPEAITRHLTESLERLQVDCIDLYWLHRDEPDIPAGEILGMLAEHVAAGRIAALGCSNWSLERQKEALEASRKLEIPGLIGSQVQWSFAHPNSFSRSNQHGDMFTMTPEMCEFHEETQTAGVGYKSQAGGFFADKYKGMDFESPDFPKQGFARAYGNPTSYARRELAFSMAEEKGCSANQIGLAWMIHHKFPAFPIVGPKNVEQLDDSMKSADIRLSDTEFKHLTSPDLA